MVLATCMSQIVFPSSVWPTAGSDLLWEVLSLQMLLLIQVGPTFNTQSLENPVAQLHCMWRSFHP